MQRQTTLEMRKQAGSARLEHIAGRLESVAGWAPSQLLNKEDNNPPTPDPYKFIHAGVEESGVDISTSGQATPTAPALSYLCMPSLDRKLRQVQSLQMKEDASVPAPPAPWMPMAARAPPGLEAPDVAPAASLRAPLPPPGLALVEPSPVPPAAAKAEALPERVDVVSQGSLGHPFACAEACKYRKRKSGCLKGASCPNCHLCHWRRERAIAAQNEAIAKQEAAQQTRRSGECEAQKTPTLVLEALLAPVRPPQDNTMPLGNAAPVPAAPTALPVPTRPPKNAPAYLPLSLAAAFAGAPVAPAAPLPAVAKAAEELPSAGSLGHPFACGWPCKYNSKQRGCKEGKTCARCHLCRWTRSSEHEKQRQDLGQGGFR